MIARYCGRKELRQAIRRSVGAIATFDSVEAAHRADALTWLASDVEIFRTVKPATPPKHLVSYCVVIDAASEHVLLVDHRDAQRWLPAGGHIEPDEHPVTAARRELEEELGISPALLPAVGDTPLFITVTRTGGRSKRHTDVSLWFVFDGAVGDELTPDDGEFAGCRWWPFDDIRHGQGTRFDPHLPRFVAKLRQRFS